MKYYFFRHGESEANKEKVFASVKINPSLTEKGKQQAANMQLVMKDIPVERIYVSPLIRAKETAEIIFPGRKLMIEDNLRETNVGVLDGVSEIEPVYWKKYKDVVEAWERGEHSIRFEGGESNEEIKARIEKILARADKECRESAAFVAHSDILRSLFWFFCENHGKTMQDNYMNLGRLTVVSRELNSHVYRIEKFNETNIRGQIKV
ncbi:MAG: histidine phosphatase family protein [Candidatus Firestonebacteria bacterium]